MSLIKIVYWSVKVPGSTNNIIDYCIKSPQFTLDLPSSGITSWNLDIGFKVDRKQNVGVYLESRSKIKEAVGCKFELVEKKKKQGILIVNSEPETHMLDIEKRSDWIHGWGTCDMITHRRLLSSKERFFPDGEIMIKAEIFVDSTNLNSANIVIENLSGEIQRPNDDVSVSDELFDLLKAAHRYKVDGLTAICLEDIESNLNTTTVLKNLSFAELNNMPNLFRKCCSVIKKFYSEIENEPEWNQLGLELTRKIHRCIILDCKDD